MRTFLSTLGIIIGVAGILALGITNQASLKSITEVFEESSGTIDLMISPSSGNQIIDQSSLRTVQNNPKVRYALPLVFAYTSLADQVPDTSLELIFFGAETSGLLLHGIDPLLEPLAREYKITQGKFLSDLLDVYEVVLVENYADDENLEVGDRIEILTPNGVERLRLVGLMAREDPGQSNNGMFGVIPLETAQRMFNRTGEYDQVDLVLQENDSSQAIENIRVEIQNRLGTDLSVTYPA